MSSGFEARLHRRIPWGKVHRPGVPFQDVNITISEDETAIEIFLNKYFKINPMGFQWAARYEDHGSEAGKAGQVPVMAGGIKPRCTLQVSPTVGK